uniref:Polymerase nucleotidyl transferase domain-containing protein n=1 Tax=Romanomermis culicivorax TaxID=13658 RepID=A0A915JPU2_ROMCU
MNNPNTHRSDEDIYYEVALKLVREAGEVVKDAFNRPSRIETLTKSSDIDLVTESDQKVEKLLFDGLRKFFKDHKLPFVAVCVGLYIEKKSRIGIVYNPILNDLYTARSGQGAFKNGFPIKNFRLYSKKSYSILK